MPPLPLCGAAQKCDAGNECGMCLRLAKFPEECPRPEELNAGFPPCLSGRVLPGEICEGDGPCGTSNTADNCGYQAPPFRYIPLDFYVREACDMPMSAHVEDHGKLEAAEGAASAGASTVSVTSLLMPPSPPTPAVQGTHAKGDGLPGVVYLLPLLILVSLAWVLRTRAKQRVDQQKMMHVNVRGLHSASEEEELELPDLADRTADRMRDSRVTAITPAGVCIDSSYVNPVVMNCADAMLRLPACVKAIMMPIERRRLNFHFLVA